jgi:hypothetical protein
MRRFSALVNDSFTLLKVGLRDEQPTKKERKKQTNCISWEILTVEKIISYAVFYATQFV